MKLSTRDMPISRLAEKTPTSNVETSHDGIFDTKILLHRTINLTNLIYVRIDVMGANLIFTPARLARV